MFFVAGLREREFCGMLFVSALMMRRGDVSEYRAAFLS